MAAVIEPIESGKLESCPSGLGERIRDLIPVIEKALKDADGESAYVVYEFDQFRKAVGSNSANPGGFVACINRILDNQFKDKTNIEAHTQRGNIRFDYVRPVKVRFEAKQP